MSRAEKFIKGCTRNCSNELCAVEDRFGKKVISYHEWITPDQALRAVEIAREEVIEVKEVDLEEEIIRYVGYPQEVDEDISTTMIRKAARHFANWQKDVFIKKACAWLENNLQGIVGGSIYIEDFRKYMKGE